MDTDQDEGFELSPEEEASLLEAIAEADAGDLVDGEQVLRELRNQRLGIRSDDPL
jgi:hypothetical protein